MSIRTGILALLALLLSLSASAAPVRAPHIEAELIAENRALLPGENWLALRLVPDAGWHTYWRNPGDTGLPTTLNWQLPAGVSAGAIHWPYPQLHRLGDLAYYGYGDPTLHLVPITVAESVKPGSTLSLSVEAKWLVCADVCIPGKAELSIRLPVATRTDADPTWTAAFADARARLPLAVDWPARFAAGDGDFSLQLDNPALTGAKVTFFPYDSDLVNHVAPQRASIDAQGLRLSQALSPYFVSAPPSVRGVLVVDTGGHTQAFELHASAGSVARVVDGAAASAADGGHDPTLWLALALAALGGLILNLMPCVFPVLSLKALAVINSRDHEPHRQRRHALAYTVGVVLSCVAVAVVLLALRAAGQAVGWGFQLQSPVFIGALVYLLFALGLALSGAVELGTNVMGLGQSLTRGSGYASSFFTGVLATVVATPCTAPFMGTALGFALTQPPLAALLIFAALGLGLALPFLLLGFFPRLGAFLPRPGAWMQTFKQLMAFPLYLTVVWLLWVLAQQTSNHGAALVMIGLVLIAFVLWLWPRRGAGAKLLQLLAFAGAVLLLAHPLLRSEAAPADTKAMAAGQEPYSEARLQQLRAEKRTVFVDLTADWCITCKVNEQTALNSDRVRAAFQAQRVVWLVGDWTREDPAITRVLERFHRSGVPLYLVYPDGGEPRVLPQILTPEIVLAALKP